MENYSYSCIKITMINFKSLNEETWPNLQSLFGDKGACGGCWCMYWRLAYKDYENGKGQRNQLKFFKLIQKGLPLGILAFKEDESIGWCSISPKRALVRLEKSRLFKTIEATPTWSITCLFINKNHRNMGLSVALIRAAAKYAFENGAVIIEAYPIIPKTTRIPAAFAWVGFINSFSKAGFEKKAQPSENRLIMQIER